MKISFKKRRLVPVGLALLTLALASGVALAYWTANGTGTGNAGAAAGVNNLTITQVGSLSAMYPGDAAQTIHLTIANGSTQSVHVTSVSATVTSTSNPGCTAADFTVGAAATLGIDIAAGGSAVNVNGPTIQFFNDSSRNQDACKGATVNLGYAIP